MKNLKKLISLLVLLFSVATFGQAEFEKIALTDNKQDSTALKVAVQSDTKEINFQYLTKFQEEKGILSTGLLKNGLLTINGTNTKYNLSAGIGIVSNFDNPDAPTFKMVHFPSIIGKTPSYLTTSNITYIAVNANGAIVESATPFTPVQRRDLIIIGAAIHSNLTTINAINNISAPSNAVGNQLHDFMLAIGALNIDGNKFSANNANLKLNKTAGNIFKEGSNFANDWKNPHQILIPEALALTFRYRTQNGTEGVNITDINPNVYDLNNVLTAVPSNRFTIQTIALFQTGLIRIQYGQETYASLSEAESAILTRVFNIESNIALNGIIRGYIVVKEGTTALTNGNNAKIIDAGKFGSVSSSGGGVTSAAILAALGFTPENVANKQNSLTVDGGGTKYVTVDAVNTKISNIDNTSDANKPVSTATQTALNLKANLANPTFTGTPAAPTAFKGTNTVQLATTAFVSAAVSDVVIADASTTVKGKIKLAGDLAGTADLPTVPALATKEPTITAGTTAQYYRGDKTFQTLDKTAVGLSNVDNTSDANKPISTATQTALNLKENVSNKNAVNGYAGVNSDGKIPSTLLPSITITDTFIVASQAAQVALVAETGDVAIRTDINKTYILKGTNSALFSDWTELLTPTSAVTSVFGRNGAVTAQSGDYTTAQVTETTNKRYQTDNQALYNDATSSIQGQINTKQTALNGTGIVRFSGTTPSYISGTSSQFVKGDGTLDSAVYAKIQMSQGYVPTYNSVPNTFGNSNIYNNGTNVLIGGTVDDNKGKLAIKGGDIIIDNNKQFNSYRADGFGLAIFKVNTSNELVFNPNWGQALSAYSFTFNGDEKMRITSTGNVGIGITSPSRKLSILGGTNGGMYVLSNAGATTLPNDGASFTTGYNVSYLSSRSLNVVGGIADFAYSAKEHVFDNGISECMRITSSGNVGIGTTSPAKQLSIKAPASNYAQFSLSGGDTSEYWNIYAFNDNSSFNIGYNNTTSLFKIATSGAATFSSSVTATNFITSSDETLKDIISTDGDVIRYKWKNKQDDLVHIGYSAQEKRTEYPDSIHENEKGLLSVSYIEILVDKIRQLEKRIELLENK